MRIAILSLFFLTSWGLAAQDEYNQPKKEEKAPEPLYETKDSIEVEKPQPKRTETSNSKAYEGMSEFKRNVRIGGAFNLGSYSYRDAFFDGQLFFIMLSPQLTYVLSDYFEGGLTTSYSYTGSFGKINAHSFSAGPILRAYPFEQVFLQVEGVGFYNTVKLDGYPSYNTFNFNAFIGGGIVSRFSKTSYLLTGVKINLMKNELTYNQIIPTAFTSIHFGLW